MRQRNLMMSAAIVAVLGNSATTFAQAAETSPSETVSSVDEVIVTGGRGVRRTVADSPIPVDILSADQISKAGGGSDALRNALVTLVPSFLVNSVNNSAQLAVAKPAGLRGLSGAHVLVLVNGKRRHNTAFPLVNNLQQAPNANPADLDQIPLSLIERIEVLRDGAAAQYGSDAIAGVINIVLKTSQGGTVEALAGRRSDSRFDEGADGEQYQARAGYGVSLPNNGSLNLGVEFLKQDYRVLAKATTQQIYPRLPNGALDPRENTINRTVFRGGLPKIESMKVGFNLEMPVGSDTAYAFGTLGYRNPFVGQSFRLPNSTSYIDEIYRGQVVQPTGQYPEHDNALVLGFRGEAADWNFDISTNFGGNRVLIKVRDSLNPSLGPASPTSFDQQRFYFQQSTHNIDVNRGFDVGLARPLNVAAGVEYRREGWKSTILDAANYVNGGYVYPSGPFAGLPAAPGGQGGFNTTPDEAARIKRSVYAGYVDLAATPLEGWDVGAAGRYEEYSDSAGNTVSGKLTTRFQVTPTLALRGAVSNGFRAPSLTQRGFTFVSSSFQVVNGAVTGLSTLKLVKPESTIGRILGATPLRPELSTNYSAGLVFNPMSRLTITADAYRIDLRNRIVQTSFFAGAGVNAILRANGLPINQLVAYNTNAVDTRTTGIDVVGDYKQDLGDYGALGLTVGFNYTKHKITKLDPTPAALQGLGLVLYNRQAQGYITANLPKTKVIINPVWTRGPLSVNLKLQRFGAVEQLTNTPAGDQHYGAEWLTDVDVSYDVTEDLRVAAGANNIFNVYPDRSTIPDVSGKELYAQNAPFDFYGAFYYVRMSYKFR